MPGLCIPADIPRFTDPPILSSPAVMIENMWEFAGGADVRGDNDLIPHKPGRAANEQMWDQTDYTLKLLIVGDADYLGNSIPGSPGVGMEYNLNALRTTVVDPDGSTGRTWTLRMPSGATREALVQVRSKIRVGEVVEAPDWSGYYGVAMVAALAIRLPDGAFV